MNDLEIAEITILRKIEQALKESGDSLLMKIVPDNCGCNKGQPKKIFVNKHAFNINMSLSQLETLRKTHNI